MAANTEPVFAKTPQVTIASALTTAASGLDGTAAQNTLYYTAGAEGGVVKSVTFQALGTNVASVARIYVNNGSTNGTASNNKLIGEAQLPAVTGTNTGATTLVGWRHPGGDYYLPSGYRIYIGLGTTVASGWYPDVLAADF